MPPLLRPIVAWFLLLAMSSASAGWSVQGQHEPNSPYDSASLMWADAPGAAVNRIYFNGMLSHALTGVNPNVGLLGGNLVVPGLQFAIAYLGVWSDCNQDGYIGLPESLALEYRAELLLSTAICPPVPDSMHNDGRWVREFLWIGWGNNSANPHARELALIEDLEARVWADDGLPWTPTIVGCPGNPPPGTFSTTGALISWLDCYGARGLYIPLDNVSEAAPLLRPFVDIEFEDHETRQCSTSHLNQPLDLFYRSAACPRPRPGLLEPGSGESAFRVWDCDSRLVVSDFEGRALVSQPQLYPDFLSHVNTEGSFYDGASHVVGGVDGQCSESGGSRLDNTYVAATPEQAVVGSLVKRETTFAMEFFNDRSGSYLGRVVDDPHAPPNAGVTALNSLGVLGVAGGSRMGSGWQSQVLRTEQGPLLRDDLRGSGPAYYTFYGYVGTTTTATGKILPGGSAKYGSFWCGSLTTGIHNGVDCDASHWWDPAHGASEAPLATWSQQPIGVHVGQTYQLRDIDCHDGSPIAWLGVQASLVMLSDEGPCT